MFIQASFSKSTRLKEVTLMNDKEMLEKIMLNKHSFNNKIKPEKKILIVGENLISQEVKEFLLTLFEPKTVGFFDFILKKPKSYEPRVEHRTFVLSNSDSRILIDTRASSGETVAHLEISNPHLIIFCSYGRYTLGILSSVQRYIPHIVVKPSSRVLSYGERKELAYYRSDIFSYREKRGRSLKQKFKGLDKLVFRHLRTKATLWDKFLVGYWL